MVNFSADGRQVQAEEGQNLLEALLHAGFSVPSLCRHTKTSHKSFCFVCAVATDGGKLVPSCSATVTEGQVLVTDSPQLQKIRKDACNLLLANHRGDCHAPCERSCYFGADIPDLLRSGNASRLLKALPFGSMTCDLCDAPCEKACRRSKIDTSVRIRQVIKSLEPVKGPTPDSEEFALAPDIELALLHEAYALAWAMRKNGLSVSKIIYNAEETESFWKRQNNSIEYKVLYDFIKNNCEKMAITMTNAKIFNKSSEVKSRSVAHHLFQLMKNNKIDLKPVSPSIFPANLNTEEIEGLLTEAENRDEASRCLHCDCRGKTSCLLKIRAVEHHASSFQIPFSAKKSKKSVLPGAVVVESGKCIACGACAALCRAENLDDGFVFPGKGIGFELSWNENWNEGDIPLLHNCVKICPTGALSLR